MKKINLIYFKDKSINGNFGDELSKFITEKLINKNKYQLVFNQNDIPLNIVCIGSYIHCAKNNSFIFGSGVRTPNNIENGHKYTNLNVCAVRGPLTRNYLIEKKQIDVPEIYGDPALLLPIFYKPIVIDKIKDKIGVVPHKTNFSKYKDNIDSTKYYLINPTDKWQNVINYICSCKAIISSSLHGLICSDTYNIPNLWLDEYKLSEGEFKFKDYFASQKRTYVKINNLNEYSESLLYRGGNNVDLNKLLKSFPFYN
jgi:pyruvyltransferase